LQQEYYIKVLREKQRVNAIVQIVLATALNIIKNKKGA